MENYEVNIILELVEIEANFQKGLKAQFAFMRGIASSNQGQKVDKTDPLKFKRTTGKSMISKTLELKTTISFNNTQQRFQDKQVKLQMAMDIDQKGKQIINKSIHLKDFIGVKKTTKSFLMVENPPVQVIYKLQVLFIEDCPALGALMLNNNKKKEKKLRFEDNGSLRSNSFSPMKQNVRNPKKMKTTFLNPKQQYQDYQKKSPLRSPRRQKSQKTFKQFKHNIDTNEQIKLPSFKSDGHVLANKRSSQNLSNGKKSQMKSFQTEKGKLQQDLEQTENKYNQIKQKYDKIEKQLKQNEKKYQKLVQKYKQLETNSINAMNKLKRQKNSSSDKQISKYKSEITHLKDQVERYSKMSQNYHQSSKNLVLSNQSQHKSFKSKYKQLESTIEQYKRQNQILETDFKKYLQEAKELKQKVYEFEKRNLQLQNNNVYLKTKLEKYKKQKEIEIKQLIQSSQQQKNNIKTSQENFDGENMSDLKKKYSALQKKLSTKQALLLKFMDMKKQMQEQKKNEITQYKKEICQLKQQISELESKPGDSMLGGNLELKLQSQKMKKDLQSLKAKQKSLYAQMSQLESTNKGLQQYVVKSKQSIANILNAVQESGNQQLIGDVYSLIE